MLSTDDNEYVSRIGPGTEMGALMREYWLPAMLSSELPHPDCDPVRVLLLGEQLIGFRDSSGKVGLLQNLCPHRGASLFFGRNEEGGLRCVYHGWKFDTTGQCVDMPNEPAESNFKTRIKATAYPCVERSGIVWAYLGPRETPPPLPGFEALELEEDEVTVRAASRDCNWLQALEGDVDTSHVGFLHNGWMKPEDSPVGSSGYYNALHKDPKFVSIDTDFGAMYGAYRPAEPGKVYWRIAQFLFPCFAHIPTDRQVNTRIWVPLDDHHTMFYRLNRKRPGMSEFAESRQLDSGGGGAPPPTVLHPVNTTGWYGRFRPVNDESNDFLMDREAQRERTWTYTGIPGTWAEDHAVTISMGPVLDRTVEHLGTSDMMIIRVRQRLMEAARALARDKIPPPGVDTPAIYRTRGCSVVLPEGADWLQATRELRLEVD